jgi:hypothetical protein
MSHYKKHPPYKNPFKPTKEEINKVYENNPTGKAAFLKMLSQSSIPNQNPFDQQLPIKWNNPNNKERNINPVIKPGAKKKPGLQTAHVGFHKVPGTSQTRLNFT